MQFKDFSKPIQIRIMLRFISIVTNSAVMPFIVLFFANQIGSVKVMVLTLLMGGVGVVGTIVGGRLTDSTGRKIAILIGESFTALGFIFLVLGQYTEQYMILLSIIAFMMTNFFAGFSLPAYSAFILDETTKETRKVIYVFMMWTGYLGLAIGSVIGGLLFADYKLFLFFIIVASSVLNIIIIALFIPETIQKARNENLQLEKHPTNTSEEKTSLLSIVIRNKVLLILLFMGFIFQFMDNQISYYLSLYLYDIFEDKSYELLGFLRTENTIIAIIFLYAVKKYMTRFQEMNIALVGATFLFAGYILLSALQVEILLYSAMFIASVGEILLFPALQGISANHIPPLYRGRYTSLSTNCGTAGAILAAMFLALNVLQIPMIVTSIYTIMGLLTVSALIRLKWLLNRKGMEKFRGGVIGN